MKTLKNFVFSMQLTGVLLLVFAATLGTATFIENDYGTDVAWSLVYGANWFEWLLFIICVNMAGSIFTRKLYLKNKLTIFLFHIAFIVIIIGAGITRFFGYEGSMHIREGETSNQILSTENYLKVIINDGKNDYYSERSERLSGAKNDGIKMNLKLNDQKIKIQYVNFIPNAVEEPYSDPDGDLMLILSVIEKGERRNITLKNKDVSEAEGIIFNVNNAYVPGYFNIWSTDSGVVFKCAQPVQLFDMMANTSINYTSDTICLLNEMKLYTVGSVSFVVSKIYPKAKVRFSSGGKNGSSNSVLVVKTSIGDESKESYLYCNSGWTGSTETFQLAGFNLNLSYGAKYIELPFSLKLNDFQLDRYPGVESPSSFASEVNLIDNKKGINEPRRIFMNNVLNYGGYRFFQSSYDPDEQGTVLSVNHDFWGTWITYLGYLLLAAGMFFTLFNKHSRFRSLLKNPTSASRGLTTVVAGLLFMIVPVINGYSTSDNSTEKYNPPTIAHAEKFGKLMVQDPSGRIEPMNTLSSELLRKISRKSKFEGMNSDQVILGMISNPVHWRDVKMIKMTHPELKKILGVEGKHASFNQIVDLESADGYKLADYVAQANEKKPSERNKFDKDVLQVDERVNICYYIYIGALLKIFPLENDPSNAWYSSANANRKFRGEDSVFVANVLTVYLNEVNKALENGKWEEAEKVLAGIEQYQKMKGAAIIPSEFKLNLEVLYNKKAVFNKLEAFYGMFGFFLLILHFLSILFPKFKLKWVIRISAWFIFLAFIVHTLGLAARWYISGHAPWSNAYESMVFIAWATVLAGIIFVKRLPIALAATTLLASVFLSVAHLNWLDPEITNLAPVLKSYWLIIHVAIITASYGFLALGSLLGFFSLLLMIIYSKNTKDSIRGKINEMTSVNEVTLISGLLLLTIGTFLGGVWANESWGRYWGWDAKETWALVTVIVYSFILHMRFIPGLRGSYAFNLASLLGYSSVLMTYFGVNFYLSGMHSYAKGDPVPIPDFVYYSIAIVAIIGILAYLRYPKLMKNQEEFKE